MFKYHLKLNKIKFELSKLDICNNNQCINHYYINKILNIILK